MKNIYLSSTCFNEPDLEKLCQLLILNDLDKLELSGNLNYLNKSRLFKIFDKYKNIIDFNIHNYFPPPKIPFVLNLAHPKTVDLSIKHCMNAIDICSYLGKSHYSLHAGISFNPSPIDLGNNQFHLPSINICESRKLLHDACLNIFEYSKDKNVNLLLENNVVTKTNHFESLNNRYHLSELNEFDSLLPIFTKKYAGILIDTGHLKVSSKTFDYDPIKMANKYNPFIKVAQLSENDGTADQNMPLLEDSWFWNCIKWERLDYISLEISNQTIQTLCDQIDLTKRKVSEYFKQKII